MYLDNFDSSDWNMTKVLLNSNPKIHKKENFCFKLISISNLKLYILTMLKVLVPFVTKAYFQKMIKNFPNKVFFVPNWKFFFFHFTFFSSFVLKSQRSLFDLQIPVHKYPSETILLPTLLFSPWNFTNNVILQM